MVKVLARYQREATFVHSNDNQCILDSHPRDSPSVFESLVKAR